MSSHKAKNPTDCTCVSVGISMPKGLRDRAQALAKDKFHPNLSSLIQYLLWKELDRHMPTTPEVKP